ncbi:unnamed protein product [Dovyalis caffra]|uniref:FIST C-domain domain-containing protein n=1 Tax=Dovyalis caffra TaxID=77055 RepID=A0AAV1RNB6_9ROSI|nr:unnamed protein product [Dovyalis caffra]
MLLSKNYGTEGNTFLVTSGLGFIGSALCLELVWQGVSQMRAFDLRPTSPWSDDLSNLRVHFIQGPSSFVALEEVVNKVLSEPIRPHFAIANVIGSGVDLSERLNFLAAKLGSKTPIIVSCASGIMGRDAVTDEHKEVMMDDFWGDGESNSDFGIILTVGFLPGLRVDAIPLVRPRKAHRVAIIDHFVMNIRDYASSVSGSTSPLAIMMFGGEDADLKPVMEKLDHAMPRETIIVGDERARFLYRSGIESRYIYGSGGYFSDAVALVFARDQYRNCAGAGQIQFHAVLSTGVSAVGPRYKAVSVKEIGFGTGRNTWLTARREGEQEILDGQRILDDVNNEFVIYDAESLCMDVQQLANNVGCPDLYIGVTEQRRCFVGSEKSRMMTFLVFHGVMGGDQEYLFANGVGIRTGDYFQFYHSDPSTALSSCSNVSKYFRNLKLDWSSRKCCHAGSVADNDGNKEVVGGFVFSCCGRGESFFGHCNVDSSPFLDNFPGVPMAGIFCGGEIGRGFSKADEGEEDGTLRCCLHAYSTVYLLVSYTPAPPEH